MHRNIIAAALVSAFAGASPCVADSWDPGDDDWLRSPGTLSPGCNPRTHGPHTLSNTDDVDYFRFTLTKNHTYRFSATGGSGDTVATLYIMMENGVLLERASNDDSPDGLHFSITYTPTEPANGATTATWVLEVMTYSEGASASYTLEYQELGCSSQGSSGGSSGSGSAGALGGESNSNGANSNRDSWDPGDDDWLDAPGSLSLGCSARTHGPHTLSGTDDVDYFRFALTKNHTYRFRATGGSGDTYATLHVMMENGVLLERATDDDSDGSLHFSLTYTPDEPANSETTATWVLEVTTYGIGDSASYTLEYQELDCSGSNTGGGGESSESNDGNVGNSGNESRGSGSPGAGSSGGGDSSSNNSGSGSGEYDAPDYVAAGLCPFFGVLMTTLSLLGICRVRPKRQQRG